MPNIHYIPRALFDTLSITIEAYKEIFDADNPRHHIKKHITHCLASTNMIIPPFAVNDYQAALQFLYSYRGSVETFNAYRRDMERLIHWAWFVREKAVLRLKRDDIEAFIEFCMKPYKRWINTKTLARFKTIEGLRCPNPEWRPFEASLDKQSTKEGLTPTKSDYKCSQKTLKATFAVLSSFYQYQLQEDIVNVNPVPLIRQKSKFIQIEDSTPVIRRLSNMQWQTVMEIAKEKAKTHPEHERTVFILTCLYGLYLRISELTASERWTPTMRDFFKDNQGHWWFKTVGKGNKARRIAVSDAVLTALSHYRQNYLKLPALPDSQDTFCLLYTSPSPRD